MPVTLPKKPDSPKFFECIFIFRTKKRLIIFIYNILYIKIYQKVRFLRFFKERVCVDAQEKSLFSCKNSS